MSLGLNVKYISEYFTIDINIDPYLKRVILENPEQFTYLLEGGICIFEIW